LGKNEMALWGGGSACCGDDIKTVISYWHLMKIKFRDGWHNGSHHFE